MSLWILLLDLILLFFITGKNIQYSDYYGDNGTSVSYPEYNISSVLHSIVGSTIFHTTNFTLNIEDVIKLRNEAKVICNNFTSYPKCVDKCLFDIYNDPCETTDLSDEHPEVSMNINN